MPDMFLEIIEMEDGDVALRRADSNEEPIMRISFSADVKQQLQEQCVDVAKVMLTTGIHMLSDINAKAVAEESAVSGDGTDSLAQEEKAPRVIH
ncbi:MAG: hypothetical protein V7731_12485 [Amphritea sp.]